MVYLLLRAQKTYLLIKDVTPYIIPFQRIKSVQVTT